MERFRIGLRARPSLLVSVLVFLLLAGSAPQAAGATIVRVEEDWELVVATPDPGTDAPQVTCVISPTGDVTSLHAALELNQQTLPSYTAGGLQLQVWEGEVPVTEKRHPNSAVLSQAGETVRWTQSMQLADGVLTFEITQGSSTTWGTFGGQGYLKANIQTSLGNLDAYGPDVSAANSAIGYAANRVQSLVLKRVRRFTSTGQQLEDDTARIIHQQE